MLSPSRRLPWRNPALLWRFPLFLSAARAPHSQLLAGVTFSFPSPMGAVRGLMKLLIFHFRRSREARAPSWPLVPPGIPKSGCTPQPGTRSQPVGPRRPAWPHHGHSANSPYRALYQTRGMLRPRGPRGVRCHPERLGHLPEDTQLQREGAGPLCLVLGRVLSPLSSKLCCPEVSPKPAQPRRRPVREHGVMSSMVGPPVPLC